MKNLNKLYTKWLKEANKGHYKTRKNREADVLSLFGNQDSILLELESLFCFYDIELSGSVLDVGCSMGGFMYSLYNSNKFDYVAGIDIDETAVSMAKQYKEREKISNDRLFVDTGSIFNLPFKDDEFDFIIMKDVGEHLENKENLAIALGELKRVLKGGGHLFIETPNYLFPLEVHLKIPMLPYISTKATVRMIARALNRDPSFVDHLNFTTPRMFESIFKQLNLPFHNAYEEYKLSYILRNSKMLSGRFKFLAEFFMIINKLRLTGLVVWIIKVSKIYPSLWYVVTKR